MADIGQKPVDTSGVDDLETLELPSLAPRDLMRHFGPGLLLMMTGIGTSHVVTAPVAGGRFEYALLWCIPVAYVFKYYGFEMAFRFTHATGRSILDAYSTARWKWPVWYVLITTIIQSAVGQAGRLVAAAAVALYFFSEYLGLDIPGLETDSELGAYAFVIAILSVLIILRGRYKAIELATKIAAGFLIVSTIGVYFFEPAPVSEFVHFFQLTAPEGSWLVIASFLGLLPTGIDVSLQASEWGKAKRAGMGLIRRKLDTDGITRRFDPFTSSRSDLTVDTSKLPEHAQEYCRRWFKIALMDFRVGHVVSFVLATIFLLLAAVWLYPSEVAGNAVMGEIARIFTDSVGPSMMLIFLLGAFAAAFSTAFNYFDGWPRVIAACSRNLFRTTARLRGIARRDLDDEKRSTWNSEYNIYRIAMLYSLIASVVFVSFIQRPVFLVLIASALAFFVAPVIYFLNLYYCFKVIPKQDKVFYPSKFATWFSALSLVVFSAMSVVGAARVFNIQLFG